MDEESKLPHREPKIQSGTTNQDLHQFQTKQSRQQNSGERNRLNSARRLGFSEAHSS